MPIRQTPNKAKVAINCLVYNHEPYLRDCLEGFVMQQTDFPFVAIVHDDASTDHSADIIREYAAKYPDIIHPIYETENQHSKKDGSLRRIMDAAIAATGAEYIALCEGDDYWTDPHKLQKQVDFLEIHSKYSFVFHPVDVLAENSTDVLLYAHLKEGDVSAEEIYERWTVPTCSVVYRKSMLLLKRPCSCPYGDIVLFLSLLDKGPAYCMMFKGGVYRRHDGGVSMHISYALAAGLFYQYKEMENLFPHVRQISIRKKNDYLDYLLYDATKIDTWKYRFYYMWLHKKLFFSAFFTTTIITYMIKPYFRYLCNR